MKPDVNKAYRSKFRIANTERWRFFRSSLFLLVLIEFATIVVVYGIALCKLNYLKSLFFCRSLS